MLFSSPIVYSQMYGENLMNMAAQITVALYSCGHAMDLCDSMYSVPYSNEFVQV